MKLTKIIENKKYSSAFTLIELLLVMAIIFIIGIISYASLGSGKKENDLKTAQREVATTIKLAQSYALQGKYVSDTVRTPCGFGFHFKADRKTYEIFYIPAGSDNCDVKNTDPDPTYRHFVGSGAEILETGVLKNNVSLQNPPNEAEIYFIVPHGNAFNSSGNPYSGQHDIILKRPGTTNKTITIGPSGSVLEQ